MALGIQSRVIWKWDLGAAERLAYQGRGGHPECRPGMPRGTNLVAAGRQGDRLVVWGLTDPSAEYTTRRLAVRGTGFEMPEEQPFRYVGTVQFPTPLGELVLHVLDLGDE